MDQEPPPADDAGLAALAGWPQDLVCSRQEQLTPWPQDLVPWPWLLMAWAPSPGQPMGVHSRAMMQDKLPMEVHSRTMMQDKLML